MTAIRLAVAALTLLAAGCSASDPQAYKQFLARDTLVHGPFLIGAERPVVQIGACCRPGAMRSQDVRGNWTPCKSEVLGCSVEGQQPAVVTTALPVGVPVEELSAQLLSRGASRAVSSRRSAWDE